MAKVRAIVLRRRNSGESDRRLTLLTLELGKIEAVAKGARKGGSRLAGSSEPLTLADMELAEGKVTHFVTQVQPISSFPALRTDYDRIRYALCLSELYASMIMPGQSASEAFLLLHRSLQFLESADRPLIALLWAQLKLLELEGVLPSFTSCVVTGLPLAETPAWVSPHAGGTIGVGDVNGFTDRFQVDAEVLIGLTKMVELDEPPLSFKRLEESVRTLSKFLEQAAHSSLPGCREIAESLA